MTPLNFEQSLARNIAKANDIEYHVHCMQSQVDVLIDPLRLVGAMAIESMPKDDVRRMHLASLLSSLKCDPPEERNEVQP